MPEERIGIRPKGSTIKRRVIYMTEEEFETIKRAARLSGISFTGFVVNTIMPIAKKLLPPPEKQ
jgi:uncharacterized protein (DUF1778 family)